MSKNPVKLVFIAEASRAIRHDKFSGELVITAPINLHSPLLSGVTFDEHVVATLRAKVPGIDVNTTGLRPNCPKGIQGTRISLSREHAVALMRLPFSTNASVDRWTIRLSDPPAMELKPLTNS